MLPAGSAAHLIPELERQGVDIDLHQGIEYGICLYGVIFLDRVTEVFVVAHLHCIYIYKPGMIALKQ